MFGFEFADRKKHCSFPTYDSSLAVHPSEIKNISPLVWQEHCVECAMPACYKTCVHYKHRSDGRCQLFKYGIERFENPQAILGQNVVIIMNEWAKLETFFFTAGFTYKKLCNINRIVNGLGEIAQILKIGKLRRFSYYIKEYVIRKIGDQNMDIPQLFLCELMNDENPYILNLENRANNQIIYRTSLSVKRGFNRFLIPTVDFHFLKGCRNNLSIYPNGNSTQRINIVSLELITLKEEYIDKYIRKSEQKVKCVIWDLDNTLWDGILGEDGIEGIKVRKEIVEIITGLDAKGIINSISSKNYEDKATEALKYFGIYDYFVCPVINWGAKSENIKVIANTLNIGMDTFVFVDDSVFELNEVKINCPGVRTCNVDNIKEYIHEKIFDVPVTEDSKRRRESYQDLVVRNKVALEFQGDTIGFLKSCKMVVHIAHPNNEELMRCYELIQRTNQLNISGERLSLKQLNEITVSTQYDCYRIRVADQFGDYGLVGFAVFDITDKNTVILKHFVFSCRAARKMIEQSFFEFMCEYYRGIGYKTLDLECNITEKNKLMRQVLEESNLFIKNHETEKSYQLSRSLDDGIKRVDLMEIFLDKG